MSAPRATTGQNQPWPRGEVAGPCRKDGFVSVPLAECVQAPGESIAPGRDEHETSDREEHAVASVTAVGTR